MKEEEEEAKTNEKKRGMVHFFIIICFVGEVNKIYDHRHLFVTTRNAMISMTLAC